MKRRDFIKSTSLLAGTTFLPFNKLKASGGKAIGLQLYTVREDIKKDLVGTLKKVAAIGYKNLELAGYGNGKFYGKSPEEFKKITGDLGMTVKSSHTGVSNERIDKIIDDALELGLEYVVMPSLGRNKRESVDDYKRIADLFNSFGEKFNKAGLKFGYHNHAFEFEKIDGQIPYDILLKNTDKDLVGFEMDLFWIKKGGHDPMEYFRKYPGRFKLWHVKDMDPASGKFTEVGSGNIDFKTIFVNRDLAGMQYYFVELDRAARPALESIEISFNYLNGADFVK